MTSRPVPSPPATGPGARPHLPPVPASTGASSRRSHKAPLAWLPWLLLGLLALTLLAVALLARAAGSGADSPAASAAGDSAAGDSAAGTSAADGSGSAASGGDAGGALAAGGQDLLRAPGGDLRAFEGQSAAGTATVQSVVADEGFWVGPSASSRVFVFLTPEARRSAGESGFQVEAGQTVSVEGSVKASSAEFAESVGVTDAEGSRQLVQQGGYVEATEVRLAD